MANVPTKDKLLQLLVVSQLEAVQKQEETLKTLPKSMGYSEKAESLRSEIATFQSRAERLSRMIDPMRGLSEGSVDREMAA